MSGVGDMPADWAIERALSRFPRPFYFDGTPWTVAHIKERQTTEYGISVRFMASQIEEHEEPPVDPLLIEAWGIAGDILASVPGHSTGFVNVVRTGNDEGNLYVECALAALRRGIEIAKGGES